MKNIDLMLSVDDKFALEISAIEDGITFARYFVQSKTKASSKGRILNLTTLVNYVVLDLIGNVHFRFINFSLPEASLDFLDSSINQYKTLYSEHYNFCFKVTLTQDKALCTSKSSTLNLDPDQCYFGCSNGKDSALVDILISKRFKKINKFFVDFDDQEFVHDYRTGREILNDRIYKKNCFEYTIGTNNFYQEHDIPLLIMAPYFSIENGAPGNVLLGIPYDNLNAERNDKLEFVITESLSALELLMNFCSNLGIKNFKIISPISSLTSFGVYTCLVEKYGWEGLQSFNSCWAPESSTGKPCMKCAKCERVNFIYSKIKKENITRISNTRLATLFGSFALEKMLLDESLEYQLTMAHIDPKVSHIEDGFHHELKQEFPGLKTVNRNLIGGQNEYLSK